MPQKCSVDNVCYLSFLPAGVLGEWFGAIEMRQCCCGSEVQISAGRQAIADPHSIRSDLPYKFRDACFVIMIQCLAGD